VSNSNRVFWCLCSYTIQGCTKSQCRHEQNRRSIREKDDGSIRYSDELIEEIRINNDIVDVVSEYVKLEKKGKNYFGLCPFHREKTPSFSVEAGKQIFYCFGCGKGGNVFHFISLAERLDFTEAVKLLADRAKIPLPESDDPREKERAELKQQIQGINLVAARFFYEALKTSQGEAALAYLRKRGISDNTVRKFGLGYSYDEWDKLYEHLKSRGISQEAMLESGLIIKGSSGNLYDRFKGRLMFPIFDIRGNVIGFGGRVLDDSLPKYMNSPETVLYNKRKHLYALNFAKNHEGKSLIVVEGYIDAISLHQRGINNAVASLGTSLTESQARLLKKYADEVIISYDADAAGQAATMRGLELLNDVGCSVRVLVLPEGTDPDEHIKTNGPDRFRKLAASALPLTEYKIKMIRKEHDLSSTEERIKFLNRAADILAKVDNAMEREIHIKNLSGEYEISEEAILSEVMRRARPAYRQRKDITGAVKPAGKTVSPAAGSKEKIIHNERFVLSLLCVDNSIYNVVKEHFKIGNFTWEENNRIAKILYERIGEGGEVSPAELLNMVSSGEAGIFARILNEECHCDDNEKAVLGKIRDIELLKTEMRRDHIIELLKRKSRLPDDEADKLESELRGLIQEIKRIKEMPEYRKERRGWE
jgi:DNA primase